MILKSIVSFYTFITELILILLFILDLTNNTIRLPLIDIHTYQHSSFAVESVHGNLVFDITETRLEVSEGNERSKVQYVIAR